MSLIGDVAPDARAALVNAAFLSTCGVSSAMSAAAGTHSAEDTPAVVVARAGDVFVSAELAKLPGNVAKAEAVIESARSALLSAVASACDALKAQLTAAAAAKEQALESERAARAALLGEARSAVGGALQVR